ncbi:MAG TPA: phosphatase PAP2 family protein [Candidatus Saccharimonadales bacterium]
MTSEFLIRLLADALLVPIVVIGGYALLRYVPRGQRFAAYSRVLMAGLTALLLAKLTATLWQPSELRPFLEQGVAPGAAYLDNPGFPSDHALFSAAIALAVYFETPSRPLAAVVIVAVVLVCLGRVLALVHTPLDVLGGLFFACVGALWYGARNGTQVAQQARKEYTKL